MRFFTFVLAALSAVTVGFAAPSVEQRQTESGGSATWYNPGLGACGVTNSDSDYIAAVDSTTFNTYPGATANPNLNPICGRLIRVTGNGNQVTVAVKDKCPTCGFGSLDLSPSAFEQLAPLSVGRVNNIQWSFV